MLPCKIAFFYDYGRIVSTLNSKQREAVYYIDGPCLVLAGAGSGKTSVITHKNSLLNSAMWFICTKYGSINVY